MRPGLRKQDRASPFWMQLGMACLANCRHGSVWLLRRQWLSAASRDCLCAISL